MMKRLRNFGAVMLIWFAGAIMGGAGVYYASGYIADRQTDELRQDHNAFVCTFRSLVIPQRARSVQAAHDMTQSESARERARVAVKNADTVLSGLLTIPRGFDCATLKST